ncbi:putative alpha/beta hydrolase domain-containing protein [Ixodes scapularis]
MSWFKWLALSMSLSYLVYYLSWVVRKPRFICKNERLRQFLLENCGKLLKERFWPPFWCIAPNLQSLVGLLLQNWQRPLSFRRQLLQLSDGGAVALDWQNESSPPGPVVLFLSGLTSDSQAYYLRTLVPMVASTQRPCVVANYRGQGDVPLVNHRLVCALSIHDLAEVIAAVKERFPRCPVLAVGYSLGGVLLGHYLRLLGDDAQIDAAVAISAPFHLPTSRRNLMGYSTAFLLNVYLTYFLVKRLRKHRRLLQSSGVVDVDSVLGSRTLYDFDNRYTAPVFGYENADDYYVHASLAHLPWDTEERGSALQVLAYPHPRFIRRL